MLKNKWSQAQLVPCIENSLNDKTAITTVEEKEIALREVADYRIARSRGYTWMYS